MYCLARVNRNSGERYYTNVFPSTLHLKVCGSPPYYKVRVSLDEDGDYWSWYTGDATDPHFRDDEYVFHFTAKDKVSVNVCFSNGCKIAEELGRGRLVRVKIEELEVIQWVE